MAITPSASTCGVWLSVPTQVSGNATPSCAWITGDIRSRLIWCMMPLPGGITSTFLNAFLVQLMKWKRSSLRRSSMARFFAKASGSKPPHSTASEWSTISCTGTTGIDLGRIAALLRDGITQAREIHQRGLAEDVVAHDARGEPREIEVTPALDELPQRRRSGAAGSQRRTRFSASTREVYGSLS